MKSVYKVLAYAVPVLVAVQAAAIAFGFFGITKWVEDGATIDKATIESSDTHFNGDVGLMIHGMNGQMLIPLVALLLLIVSFFAKVPGGSKWAGFVLLDVVVQVALAFVSFGAPIVGVLHGVNALFLAWLGWTAAHRVSTVETAERRRDEPALI